MCLQVNPQGRSKPVSAGEKSRSYICQRPKKEQSTFSISPLAATAVRGIPNTASILPIESLSEKEERKRQHAHPSTMPYIPNSQTNFAFPGLDAKETTKMQALFVWVNTTLSKEWALLAFEMSNPITVFDQLKLNLEKGDEDAQLQGPSDTKNNIKRK